MTGHVPSGLFQELLQVCLAPSVKFVGIKVGTRILSTDYRQRNAGEPTCASAGLASVFQGPSARGAKDLSGSMAGIAGYFPFFAVLTVFPSLLVTA
jgi:hypothetical protein